MVLEGVRRRFGTVDALAGLDLVVPANRITVLLGPNGAGKTTAIRMITGALDAHSGTVRTFGLDPARRGEEVRLRCGVVSAKPALYDRLDAHANLSYAAELYGMGRGPAVDARIRESAARFGIDHALDQRVGGFSTGMKTRLALARSILHQPDLLLFDEPTSGLDPESSHAVLEMIREMTDNGRTVVMCTHLLLEAEGLADTVVVMEDGRDLVAGTPDDLTRQFWPGTVVLVAAENPESFATAGSIAGVKMRMRAVLTGFRAGRTKTVSERLNSRAMRSICASFKPSASSTTPSGLPSRGVFAKTSSVKNRRAIALS